MLSPGVYTVAPTPLHDDGTVDLQSVGRLTEFLVDLGVDGLLVLGVMGEAHKLLDEERHAVLRSFIKAADGRIAIITGTSFPSTEGAAQLTRQAHEMGADAVLLSPPRMLKPNPAAVQRFFEQVAAAAPIEVVIQDHPTSSGVHMSAQLIAQLSDNIDLARSLKLEDPPTPPKFTAVRNAISRELNLFGGLGGAAFIGELERGAAGTMTGFAFPEVLIEIYQLFTRGEPDQARSVFYRYLPLLQLEAQEPMSLAMRKYVYQQRGAMAGRRVREPAGQPDPETLKALDRLIKELGLPVG